MCRFANEPEFHDRLRLRRERSGGSDDRAARLGGSQSYTVAAKAGPDFPNLPAGENGQRVRQMLRAMLEDRFHLRLHTEIRQAKIFELRVARGGFKFPAVAPPVPPAKEGHVGMALGDDGGRMIGRTTTISDMPGALTLFLNRPVIDKTRLKGYYDFEVKWRAPGPASSGLGAEGIGLRVVEAKGSVEYWVMDHVEPPTKN
jgi:uncharacterized protein (TIGR03435 family)